MAGTASGWSRKFDAPIILPNGKKLVTLNDAIDYLGKSVPKAEHQNRKVLIAATSLTNAAEGRDLVMHARIATLQALNRHVKRVFNPDRKDHRWGKRKLKRDE